MTETPAWARPANGFTRTIPPNGSTISPNVTPSEPEYVPWDLRTALDLSRFLADLRTSFGDRPFTVRAALDGGVTPPLATTGRASTTRSVGRLLLNREGRWIDGHRVVCTGREAHTHARLWKIEARAVVE